MGRRPARNRLTRLLGVATSAMAVVVLAWGCARVGHGQDVSAKRVDNDLLRSMPFDRVTLVDDVVILIDPLSPRPLPPYDPAKDKAVQAKKVFRPPAEGNVGVPGEKTKIEVPGINGGGEDRSNDIVVHLLQIQGQGDWRDFRVKRSQIKRVEYFEDMLIVEGERRMLAHDFSGAFECYLRVRTRQPKWAGLDEHVDRLLFEEGAAALLASDGERGLRLLRELFNRQPNYAGLADKLATAFGDRASRAFDLGLYAKGRKILHDLAPLAPDHPLLRTIRDTYIAKARRLVEESEKKTSYARLDTLSESLVVWPALDGAGAKFADAFNAARTLDVAVDDIPRTIGPWVRTPADERVTRMLYLPILAHDDEDATAGKSANQLADAFESTDLGRKLSVKVRPGIAWSDGSRTVSAFDVSRAFTDRADPSSPCYNARWADLLVRVETPEEDVVQVHLTRSFLKAPSWLLWPVGPSHAGWDGRVATLGGERRLVGDGRFRWVPAGKNRIELHLAESSKSSNPAEIRRLRETRYHDTQAAVGALLRGEVSLLEHLPPDRVASLATNPEFKIGRFARPSLHRIALDGRNPILRNRTLRRGLSYAINRATWLEETVLKHPPDEVNRVSDGPFESGNYADATDVSPLGYDPLLARMLVVAARKELGGTAIRLSLEYPATPEPRAIIPKLVEAWRLIGVEVEAIERPESELESKIRSGQPFDLAYRASRCMEPLLEAGGLICPGYDAPPSTDALGSVASPRILQLLLQLERAPELPSAKGLLIQIDRECRDELPILPLWQIEDHYAWRTRLKGPAEVADHLYQGIETWEIAPWYAKDSW